MPPKGKEKPKTKKELKAEAEAAARAAEEERLRREAEAKQVAEQIEQHRQELLHEYAVKRDAKLLAERQELVPILHHLQQQRDILASARATVTEWEHYLVCSPLPDPKSRPAMNDFLNTVLQEADTTDLQKTLQQCEACLQLAEQCLTLAAAEEMAASLQEALNTYAIGPAGTTSTADSSSATQPAPAAVAHSQAASSSGAAAVKAGAQAAQDVSADVLQEANTAEGLEEAAVPLSAAGATAPAAAPAAWDAAAYTASCEACRTRAVQHQQDAAALYDSIERLVDAATAHVLHRADEYANPKGDVLLTAQQGVLQWGLWVNTHKNPRFKLIDLGGLGMTVEIPKQIALASVALRVQRHPCDTCVYTRNSSSSGSSNTANSSSVADAGGSATAGSCLSPLGGVFQVELLSLPPPPKTGKGWTIRQVSTQSGSLSQLPYPIPPVGADPNTWRPDEEPSPVNFNIKLPERLLIPATVRVGWWDASKLAWSEEGISNAAYDAAAGCLSFSSVHLGCLALLQDTSVHLPYSSWTIRPTGGVGGCTAVIDLQVPGLPKEDSSSRTGTVSIEVGSGWAKLRAPALPQLGLIGKALPPWELLSACAACGLQLMPSSREQAALGLLGKDAAAEQAMCADVASLCTKFLIASSRWNRDAGQDVVLVRLSAVTDWEEGGRTSSQAATRIFNKEAAEGPRQVLVARREGALGVTWANSGDNQPEPPASQDLSTVEAVLSALEEGGTMHASLLHLLNQQPYPADGSGALSLQAREVDAGLQGSMTQLLLALHVFVYG